MGYFLANYLFWIIFGLLVVTVGGGVGAALYYRKQAALEAAPKRPELLSAPLEPEAKVSRLVQLRRRLASKNNPFARGLLSLLSFEKLDEEHWEAFEDQLLAADLGAAATDELVNALRTELAVTGVSDPVKAKEVLRRELVRLVDPSYDRSLHLPKPAVILVVGVNGTGKTTTIGKLAKILVDDGKKVVLGAADTFRAAAVGQLSTWGERAGVEVVKGAEGADPASVAFNTVSEGLAQDVDVMIVDTAGRLHAKTGLMDELGKIKRVIEKQAEVNEVLLVIDATTGQNGLVQAKVFKEVVGITGIVLTKLDGSAKGGIVISVQRELGVPVKFVGLGEGQEDLAAFDAEEFVDALLSED